MEVTLSRNSWHYRLQNFVFNDVPFQKNFCPYFWLTIFCIFAFPFVGIWTLVKKPLLAFFEFLLFGFEKVGEVVDEKVCTPYRERSLESVTPEQAFVLWEAWEAWDYYYVRREGTSKLAEKFRRWKEFYINKFDSDQAWRDFIEKGRIEVEKRRAREQEIRREREEQEALRKARIQKMHLAIIKVTKVVFYALGTVLALGFAYLSLMVFALMWSHREGIWSFLVTYGPATLGAIVLIMLLVGLIFGAVHLGKCYARMTPPKIKEEKKDGKAMSSIKGFFSFFWLFIVNFKKNHCPHIEWVESPRSE